VSLVEPGQEADRGHPGSPTRPGRGSARSGDYGRIHGLSRPHPPAVGGHRHRAGWSSLGPGTATVR